ncbi:hypothetical protein HanPSC8_Chr06g0243961 [Helianthus annuus]|nr:hypothetical protein HanPSC8_Chr06g0243961 [Helianthus annuus]
METPINSQSVEILQQNHECVSIIIAYNQYHLLQKSLDLKHKNSHKNPWNCFPDLLFNRH